MHILRKSGYYITLNGLFYHYDLETKKEGSSSNPHSATIFTNSNRSQYFFVKLLDQYRETGVIVKLHVTHSEDKRVIVG